MHTGNRVVERSIQTLNNMIRENLEDGLNHTESVNRALRVMHFAIHTGLKVTPFEIHHWRKPRTELTNIVINGTTVLSNWSKCLNDYFSTEQNEHFYWCGPGCGRTFCQQHNNGKDKDRGETPERRPKITVKEKFGLISLLFCWKKNKKIVRR